MISVTKPGIEKETSMTNVFLYALWGGLFSICAFLGFIPEPDGAFGVLCRVLALGCFLPPAAVLYRSRQGKDREAVKLVRNLSALSLGLTLVLLVCNFLSALAPEWLGTVLHYVLAVVSSPMLCSGHWAWSLFGWACLLMAALGQLRQEKRKEEKKG